MSVGLWDKFLNSKYRYLSLFAWFILLIFIIRSGLFYNNFNLDEVILFFSSIGRNLGEVNTGIFERGTLAQTWHSNRTGGSIDPGLFTLILRYWSAVSTEAFWLRSLPILFFFATYLIFFFEFKNENQNFSKFAFLLPLVFSNELVLSMSLTVRPYTMELCGFAFVYYLLRSGNFRSQLKSEMLHSLILTFLLGSRYILWFIFVLFLLIDVFSNWKVHKLKVLRFHLLPILYMSLTTLFVTKYQFAGLSLDYTKPFFALSSSNVFWNQVKNPFTYFLLCYPIYYFTGRKLNSVPNNKNFHTAIFFLGVLFIFLILEISGLSPFNLNERFTISYHAAGICSVFLFFRHLLKSMDSDSLYFAAGFALVFSFFQAQNFQFKPQSEIVQIVSEIKKSTNENDVIQCDPVVYSMISFLKNYSNLNVDWNKIASFKSFDPNNFGLKEVEPNLLYLFVGNNNQYEKILAEKNYIKMSGSYFLSLYGPKK